MFTIVLMLKPTCSSCQAWIEGYNESLPRKTPQMKSLRKLMRSHHLAACPV